MTLSVLLILTIIPPMLAVMLRGPFEEEFACTFGTGSRLGD